jgi:hypothetical protein
MQILLFSTSKRFARNLLDLGELGCFTEFQQPEPLQESNPLAISRLEKRQSAFQRFFYLD